MGRKNKRSRLWVDPPFQSRLLARVGFYLLLYTFTMLLVGFMFELQSAALTGARRDNEGLYQFLGRHKPFLITLVLFAPILCYDLLRFSHRIAGPLYRCRKVMQEMAAGNPVPEFVPRKHDLMRELFQDFNKLILEWNSSVKAKGNCRLGEREPTSAAV